MNADLGHRTAFPALQLGRSATARLLLSLNWSNTPLGDLSTWPEELVGLIAVIMHSPVAMTVMWGRDGVLLYNDAYAEIVGTRHPAAFGRRAVEVWPEAAAFNSRVLEKVLAGETLHFDDQEFLLEIDDSPEPAWFTLDYSPVPDAAGVPTGVLAIVSETTGRVLAERALEPQRERLRQMFEQAPSFMAVLSGPHHQVELANPNFLRLIGGRPIVGRAIAEALPDVVEQGYLAHLDHVYHSGKAFSATDARYALRADPAGPVRERFVDVVFQPLFDEARQVVGIFVEGVDATDRVEAERDAIESRERLELALSNAQIIGLWDWRIPENRVFADERFAKLFGVDPALARTGAPIEAFLGGIFQSDRERVSRQIDQAIKTGEPYASEFRVSSAELGVRHLLARGGCEMSHDGSPLRFPGVIIDLTQQRQAEAAFHGRENELKLSLEAGQLGAWSLDLNTLQLTTSAQCREHFGADDAAEFTYETIMGTVHPEDRARMRAAVRRTIEEGHPYDIEYRILTSAAELRWIAVRGELTINPAGNPTLSGVSSNVTRRRREDAHREALNELGSVIQGCDDPDEVIFSASRILGETLGVGRVGYGTIDTVAQTLHVAREWTAPGVESLAGSLRLREYGTFFDSLKHGELVVISDVDEDARTVAGAAALKARGASAFVNVPVLEKSGLVAVLYINHAESRDWEVPELRLIKEVAERTRAASERIRSALALKASEARLREINDSLESTVEARTRALLHAEEALRQSQKMEAVGQLTGGIAHDFNNLLQGITGSLDLVQQRIAQGRLSDLDRLIGGAVHSAKRAASLTHRLLAFSRRQPLAPRPVHPNGLLVSMEDLLRRTLGENIEFDLVLAPDVWTTWCDTNQLENAVLNLVINARDAMPQGGKLRIETHNASFDESFVADLPDVKPGHYACLSVTDTGIGMTVDTINKAFEPFYTTKPIGQGTGLGLSMIYGFMRQSDGYAKIESEVGSGTSVRLFLPRHGGAPEAAGEEEAGTATLRTLASETVLVVEDEPVVRALVVEVLNDLGYRTLEASDGPSGLAQLQSRHEIDLLVSDIGLPGLNGRQIAEAGLLLRPTLKILFMTGYAENATRGDGFLGPRMSMITKPFSLEVLAERVKQILEAGQEG